MRMVSDTHNKPKTTRKPNLVRVYKGGRYSFGGKVRQGRTGGPTSRRMKGILLRRQWPTHFRPLRHWRQRSQDNNFCRPRYLQTTAACGSFGAIELGTRTLDPSWSTDGAEPLKTESFLTQNACMFRVPGLPSTAVTFFSGGGYQSSAVRWIWMVRKSPVQAACINTCIVRTS